MMFVIKVLIGVVLAVIVIDLACQGVNEFLDWLDSRQDLH